MMLSQKHMILLSRSAILIHSLSPKILIYKIIKVNQKKEWNLPLIELQQKIALSQIIHAKKADWNKLGI